FQFGAEEDEIAAGRHHGDRHVVHEHDEGGQGQRSELVDLNLGALGPEKPEPDAQKTAEQNDVREIGQVEDVAAEPANESQLDEEHEEAQNDQSNAKETGVRVHGSPNIVACAGVPADREPKERGSTNFASGDPPTIDPYVGDVTRCGNSHDLLEETRFVVDLVPLTKY
ncbi:MAG: hypothetical protein RL550_1770, partial [Actinomycetota bacterium]